MIIPAIKPTARESYDRSWKPEKDEENRFASRPNNDQRRKRRWDDLQDKQDHEAANTPYTFDNPAFNIIAASTNYLLSEITSEMQEQQGEKQLELFQ